MRDLTQKEKEIVKLFVKLKQDGELIELQTAKILRKRLSDFLAITWTSKPKDCLTIYYDANDESSQVRNLKADNALKKYFEVCDYLYFIQELEENKMIAIQTISSEKPDEDIRALYDKELYDYNRENNNFYIKGTPKELTGLNSWSYQHTYTDVVSLLNDYLYGKIIYPLPLLEDLVECEYKSIEQRNFEKQINKTNCSLKIAFAALIISATMPFLVDRCAPPTEIDNTQLKTIEQAIINNKATYPSTINIQLSDTLKIKNISPVQK